MRSADLYGRATVPVLTAAQAAQQDWLARERHGIPERVLMENAGRGAALVLQRLYPRGRIVAAVGPGNNGGDAFVMLRNLKAWGRDVAWIPAASRVPDAALLHSFHIPALDLDEIGAAVASAAVLVDGLLGTGSSGAPREGVAALIREFNGAGHPILALDLPSGIDPDTGAVAGDAIAATVTVTFGWPKRGLFFHPARALCGRILAVEIGFPPFEGVADARLVTPLWAEAARPRRAPDAHKGSAGQLALVAGSRGMAGAAVIASRAAYRTGVGSVRVVSSESNREILQKTVPEAVFRAAEDGDIAAFLADADALVVGPGLGTTKAANALLDAAIAAARDRPIVLDADALNLIGRDEERLRAIGARGPALLTPHPKELTRLTGGRLEEVRRDPIVAAAEIAERSGCTVLLKGQPSVVTAPGAPTFINTTGSSDLATAGMGDQLAGMAGAFLAAGAVPDVAGSLALFYGGRAARLAGRGASLVPDDVTDALPLAWERPGRRRPPHGLPFVVFDQPPPA